MRRPSSTVVVIAGEGSGELPSELDGLHNVRALTRAGRPAEEVTELVRGLPRVVPDRAGPPA